ncbi:MAG: T9SS type A sorting domain-containing protein [Crocinitomicaceae bacterium]|nr:T9SS type A sorting domain-containing protein [Crocinitomicaceae bacterium]
MRKKSTSLFFILFAASTFAQIPTDNLICDVKFNNNLLNDGSSNDGFIEGDVAAIGYATARFGNPNAALSLDNATAGWVSFGDVPLDDPDYSISFWINFNAFTVNQQKLISKREICGTGSFFDITLYPSPNTLVLENYASGDPNSSLNYNTAIDPAVWVHITYVLNQTDEETKLYLDGVLVETIAWTTSLADGSMNNSSDLGIGWSPCVSNPNVDYYDGLFDDLRIYTRPLTDAEVTAIYNEADPLAGAGISDDTKVNGMEIYPNPASHNLNVELINAEAIQIIDVAGTVILSSSALANHTIDISLLSKGIYFVRTASGQTEKFIKL